MTGQREIIKTVIDIGNSKIKVLTGELFDDWSRLRALGYNETPTQGLKKSIVENPELLMRSIESAVKETEYKIGRKIDKVTIGISSPNIKSRTINKRINFPEKEISSKEIEQLYKEAEREIIGTAERVLKKEMYNIRVNKSGIVKNPRGILGKELQAEIHFITLNEAELNEYEEVINRAGYTVEGVELNGYCSAESVLGSEDKAKGVALIDIGEGITDIIMYKNGKMIYSKSIPLGCMHYISDLSYILEIDRTQALDIINKLKMKDIADDKIKISNNKSFTATHIRKIIDARTGDIAKFIVEAIEESGFNGYLGKGIVITGGAVVLDELIGQISASTGYVVAKKKPESIEGLEDRDPAMASILGNLLEVMKNEYQKLRELSNVNYEDPDVEEDSKISFTNLDEKNEEEKEKIKKVGIFRKIKNLIEDYI